MIVLSITDSHNSQNYDNNNCKKKKKNLQILFVSNYYYHTISKFPCYEI